MRSSRWVCQALAGLGMLLSVACGDDDKAPSSETDADGDGWAAPADCDDDDASVFPGADETPYDDIDQDCSGSDLSDVDGDGYDGGDAPGAAGASGVNDCDDRRADVNPAAVDVCGDGVDQDCSGRDQACGSVDLDGDGSTPDEGDCNDQNPDIGPDAEETYYNGVDDDCDGDTVDGDQDGDGFSFDGGGDCDDQDAAVFPGADEIAYDGVDQDCSGTDLTDVDGDGVDGGPDGADCDDLDASVHPESNELVGDGVDQNCDGSDLAGVDSFRRFDSAAAVAGSPAFLAAGVDGEGEPLALAAWADSRNADRQDVYGQLVNANGGRIGREIEIALGGLSKSDVRAAAFEDVFLVTWSTVDGVFGQLVSGDGDTIGNELPIGPASGAAAESSYGADNFAVAWLQTDTSPLSVSVRALSIEGVRGETNVVDDAGASSVAISSTSEHHLVFWTGQSGQGLFARRVNGIGEPTGEVIELLEDGPYGDVVATSNGSEHAVVLQLAGPTNTVRAIVVDSEAALVSEAPARLSLDSSSTTGLQVTSTPGGFFAAWNDGRHSGANPSVQAVYANEFDVSGAALFSRDWALHADVGVALGGVALVGSNALLSTRTPFGLGSQVVRSF